MYSLYSIDYTKFSKLFLFSCLICLKILSCINLPDPLFKMYLFKIHLLMH